ncbi:beta-ketoacyl-[acyl-carrier-protein] synthase II [Faecalibacillus faecis]|uniref:3-oxoacyl-[acyl-carrier-protein] synthase 2 n=1 Tax=Faecalibacillus faecis TaxID=1982628 RepID=A0A2T3FPH3_9FIRM|nr:beta-ketoacyl-ACP synthase II [Faecalibacillus faecis]MBS5417256.1 beta-ketoacyl-ACP synthase II [Coprobacillus sp.]RHQ83438.1 beta-ketoacyl-[acyl-carrier-protein] synthase II [Coprobacillus sp. AF21-8LB]MCB7489754.1 beta-ketoacyl-ACP synthase II [Faecalibacillus faecis]MCG4593594.1 beta-ketoacyl-ACP synthase II [Faecalibacillus faecis]MEE0492734.1 beta-ketoacyl-ACP synthase II [Faecalibacillus faecis]
MKRRVVVTGLGALTPIGNNVEDSWQGILNHQCGIDFIQKFDTTHMKVKVAGELKNFEATDYLDKKDIRKMDPFIQYGLIASHEAIKDAKLDVETIDHDRFGVVVSSGIGGLGSIEENHNRALKKGFDRVSPYFIPMTISNLAAGQIAIAFKAQGLATCPVTACAGGTNAIGDAFRNIRDGYLDVALAGGCEASITPLGIGGFTSMKALSESSDPKCASIPFDKERNGFVMGEGAGILVLEELEHAKKRGAPIYCEMVGYGVSCDAYHMTAPAPEGIGGAKAMIHALKDASIKASQIDYINAHGTSTPMNDKLETAAIKKAFGEHAQKLAVSSTKGNTGHCLGAAGGIEGVFCVKALDDNFIPATINYQNFDEECDLDIVANSGRKQELHYVMSNSLGFGGHNASIIFKKYGEE